MGKNTKAFPNSTSNYVYQSGMELRDYFAAKILASLLIKYMDKDHSALVIEAYDIADLMIAHR